MPFEPPGYYFYVDTKVKIVKCVVVETKSSEFISRDLTGIFFSNFAEEYKLNLPATIGTNIMLLKSGTTFHKIDKYTGYV